MCASVTRLLSNFPKKVAQIIGDIFWAILKNNVFKKNRVWQILGYFLFYRVVTLVCDKFWGKFYSNVWSHWYVATFGLLFVLTFGHTGMCPHRLVQNLSRSIYVNIQATKYLQDAVRCGKYSTTYFSTNLSVVDVPETLITFFFVQQAWTFPNLLSTHFCPSNS